MKPDKRRLWKDAELCVASCDLVYRADKRRCPEARDLRICFPHFPNLVVRNRHRLLETGVNEVDLVGASRHSFSFRVRESPASILFDDAQQFLKTRCLKPLAHPAEANV